MTEADDDFFDRETFEDVRLGFGGVRVALLDFKSVFVGPPVFRAAQRANAAGDG